MAETFKEAMNEMQTEVNQHLSQCCEEILHWHSTGILIDGYVRGIAAKLLPFETGHHLSIVEATINSQAMMRLLAQEMKQGGPDGL